MTTSQLGHVELASHRIELARGLFARSASVFQAIGNPICLSWCVEGIAALAAADGRFDLAAQLCAAREAILARLSSTLPSFSPTAHATTVNSVHAALGPEGLAAAEASAKDRPLPTLISQALSAPGR
jgi:hypothetical protein